MDLLTKLKVKIYADGADMASILRLNENPLIKGLTTNPTLMRKAGISDYEAFAKEVLESVNEKPISFEVFSDDFEEMKRQALKMMSWQNNVYVKIPITNTRGESAVDLIKHLSSEGVQLNITAILTLEQVEAAVGALQAAVRSVISVLAGRIANTGIDPVPFMKQSMALIKDLPKSELLWASVREVLNIFHAEQAECDIVTVPHPILDKAIEMCGMNLSELSLDTVKMFYDDAKACGFNIATVIT